MGFRLDTLFQPAHVCPGGNKNGSAGVALMPCIRLSILPWGNPKNDLRMGSRIVEVYLDSELIKTHTRVALPTIPACCRYHFGVR
jgi:hypothetical protein